MARSEELRALAQRVADALPPEAIEIVLTGSVSRGVADDVSDIEMLVVTEEQLSLEEAFELARRAGLEKRDSWGDPSTPTRRVFGYLDGRPVETIWWSREFAEEHFEGPGSDQALLHGVALRTSGLLERWQQQLAVYPDELAAERIEKAAERWGAGSRREASLRLRGRTPRWPAQSGSSSLHSGCSRSSSRSTGSDNRLRNGSPRTWRRSTSSRRGSRNGSRRRWQRPIRTDLSS